MPKAKKQKNGKWRCQLYLGDEVINGKRKQIVKSFTASTKSEAEDMASEYRLTFGSTSVENITLGQAIDRYIASKSNVLSPSTIRGYRKYAEHILDPISDVSVRKLTPEIVQNWINNQAEQYSPKSIKNANGLLTAAVTAIYPSFHVRVTFPKKKRAERYIPSYKEVMTLIDGAPSENLRRAIMLAAFCSLRRGEICALTFDDIDYKGGWISVSKDMVMDEDAQNVVKDVPKTDESNRRTPVPRFVLEELDKKTKKESERVVDCLPNAISKGFVKLVRKCDLPHIRFHDLRHFFASYLHLKGIPDAYIEKYGGWKPGSSVMKEVYRNTINQEEIVQADNIVRIFSEERKKKSRA